MPSAPPTRVTLPAALGGVGALAAAGALVLGAVPVALAAGAVAVAGGVAAAAGAATARRDATGGVPGGGSERLTFPAPPTADEILAALDDLQARIDGKVPPAVEARVTRISGVVRDTVPRLSQLGGGSAQAHTVVATATSYLPEAVGAYLRLPRSWADRRPVANGKTSLMVLCDQLDLLAHEMDGIFDAVCRADADALVAHGRFLAEKFGQSGLDTGGMLTGGDR